VRGLLIAADRTAEPPGPAAVDPAPAFDPELPWRRARSVALRPEPFGALVYHFGNRKLSFLKSRTLVAVVESLAEHPSATATLAACGVSDAQRGAYVKALADLARSNMIERRPPPPPAPRTPGAGPCGGAESEENPA
jgi:mycofactocin biosynthesis protein MftB